MKNKLLVDTFRAYHLSTPRYIGSAPCLVATLEDVDFIKKAARLVFAWVAPQQRLELVARALRFGSYAALLEGLKTSTPESPLILQMSTSPRDPLAVDLFLELLERGADCADGFSRMATDLLGPGAAFLRAFHVVRSQLPSPEAHVSSSDIFVNGEVIPQAHLTLSLQKAPAEWKAFLEGEGCVLSLDTPYGRLELAPLAACEDIIGQRDAVSYERDWAMCRGPIAFNHPIPLRNAHFYERHTWGFDVLPFGWRGVRHSDLGADTLAWRQSSHEERLSLLSQFIVSLVKIKKMPKESLDGLEQIAEFEYARPLATTMGLTLPQYIWSVLSVTHQTALDFWKTSDVQWGCVVFAFPAFVLVAPRAI